jgi:hypothetical protein
MYIVYSQVPWKRTVSFNSHPYPPGKGSRTTKMDAKTYDVSHSEDAAAQQEAERNGNVRGTARIHASRMEEALLQEKPRAWRKSFLKLYACIFVAYLCSATNGFDANTFGMTCHCIPRSGGKTV